LAYQSKDHGARSPVPDVAIGLLLHRLDLHLLVHTNGAMEGKQASRHQSQRRRGEEEYER
jgi:hypothetical protein